MNHERIKTFGQQFEVDYTYDDVLGVEIDAIGLCYETTSIDGRAYISYTDDIYDVLSPKVIDSICEIIEAIEASKEEIYD